MRRVEPDLIAVDDVRRFILASCPVIPRAPVRLGEALGCVTVAPIVASHDVPSFANSAMDGFAVRAADTLGAPVDLEVVGTAAAGSAPGAEVSAGRAVRIMTGAVLPVGADAIVMVERTSPAGDGRVLIEVTASPGDHVRRAGEDLRAGQVVFEAGTELEPGHLGVLASVGIGTLDVATSSALAAPSCGPARSATATGPCFSPSSPGPAVHPSISAPPPTTNPPSPHPSTAAWPTATPS